MMRGMKSQAKIIIAIIGLLSLFRCDQSADKILYNGPAFVFMDTKETIPLYENQKTPLKIPVKVSSAQSENTQVTFEVVGDNVLLNSDYKIQTTSPVEITRAKYETNILVQPVDNSFIQPESRTITIRIKSVNNPKLQIQVVKEVTINLLDDDCAPTVPKVSIWVGDLNVSSGGSSATGTGEGGVGGICGGSLVVTAKLFGSSNPSTTMTILMTQNPTSPTRGTASVIRFPAFGADSPLKDYQYEASGAYDETAKTITLNFILSNPSDATFTPITGTNIITPK
jgi:hypothetical protein